MQSWLNERPTRMCRMLIIDRLSVRGMWKKETTARRRRWRKRNDGNNVVAHIAATPADTLLPIEQQMNGGNYIRAHNDRRLKMNHYTRKGKTSLSRSLDGPLRVRATREKKMPYL